MIIDSHQHIIYPDKFNYEWTAELPALQGAFTLDKYWQQADKTSISGTLFMEVDVPEKEQGSEARFFCKLAENPENRILGVIASARPEKPGFKQYLNSIDHPALKGVRRVFHTISGELPINDSVIENLNYLGEKGLSFDLCALPHQHQALIPLIQACKNTRFILDHCGIPAITEAPSQEWISNIGRLAQETNVYCKVSGIIAYCPESSADAATLQPYFDVVLDAFGIDRLVFGGDWPVCNLTSTLEDWVAITAKLLYQLNDKQKRKFWYSNAIDIYNLDIEK